MESQNEKDYMEIDLVEIFYVIRDNLRNIFVVMFCCVAVAAAYVLLRPPAAQTPAAPASKDEGKTFYRSAAMLRIKQLPNIVQTSNRTETRYDLSGDGVLFGMTPWATETSNNAKSEYVGRSVSQSGYGTMNLAQRMATYANIFTSQTVRDAINEELGYEGVAGASPVKDTELMSITFKAEDPETAQRGNELLVRHIQQYMAEKGRTDTRYVVSDDQSSQVTGSNATVEMVITEQAVLEVIDPPSLPEAPLPPPEKDPKKQPPAPPSRKRPIIVGALLGFLLGCGYAVMHYLMNRKITTRQDIEDYLGLPVLAVVPEEKSLTEAMARKNDQSVLQKIGGLLWKEQN